MKKLLIGILSLSLLLTALVPTVLTVSANGSLTLVYDSMPDGSLYMTFTADADAAPKYYWADVTVDGTAQRKVLEIGPDWAPNNAFFWGLGATQSVEIAAGTVLPQCDPNTGDLIVGGKQLTLTETFQVVNENGEWKQVTEVAELTLSFRSVEGGSSLYMGFTAPAAYTQKYYWVDVTADGASARMLLEIGPDWAADHAFNWSFSATESLEIAAGAEVVQCDPINGELISGGKKLVLTEAFAIYNTANGWTTAKPTVTPDPLDVTLTFHDAANDNWRFTVADTDGLTAGQWYTADITVDGAARTVLLEYCEGAGFYIYSHCFGATPSTQSAPTSSVLIAADTVLTPVSLPPNAANVVAGGQTLKMTDSIDVELKDGVWVDNNLPKPIPTPDPLDVTLTFEAVGADNTWSYLYPEVPAVESGWFVVTATVDGVERQLPIEFYKDGERFYHYAHTFNGAVPAASLKIEAGAVLTPISDPFDPTSVVAGGQPLKMTDAIDMELKDGVWVDKLAVIDLSDALSIGISFYKVDGTNVLWLNAHLSDKSAIMDTYGDWTSALGTVRLGNYQADGTILWTVDQAAIFSVTGTYFHMSGIDLSAYDAVQIDPQTVVLPAAGCDSDRPMVLANGFRMTRNEDDEWVVDEEFSKRSETDEEDIPSSTPTGEKPILPIVLCVIVGFAAVLALCVILGKKKEN